MKAVLTVIGKDTVGILAKIADLCADKKAHYAKCADSKYCKYCHISPLNNSHFLTVIIGISEMLLYVKMRLRT